MKPSPIWTAWRELNLSELPARKQRDCWRPVAQGNTWAETLEKAKSLGYGEAELIIRRFNCGPYEAKWKHSDHTPDD